MTTPPSVRPPRPGGPLESSGPLEPGATAARPPETARPVAGPSYGQIALARLPGFGVAAVGVAVAYVLNRFVPVVAPLVWAALLGALFTNLIARPMAQRRPVAVERMRPGLAYVSKRVLRIGVVGLGLQLAFGDVLRLGPGVLGLVVVAVAVTFVGTRWIGRLIGVSPGTSLMVATGFSICGASAIAAMDAVAGRTTESSEPDGTKGGRGEHGSSEVDVATALALVTVFGGIAIVLLPWLGSLLGSSSREFGTWTGASVQEVAQVVAAASTVPGAVGVAVAVKLTRVLTLAPMIALTGYVRNRSGAHPAGTRRPPIVPLFVVGFLAAVALRSTGLLPAGLLEVAKQLDTLLLAAAMFGLGTAVDVTTLRRTGARPVLLGVLSWALMLAVTYLGVRLTV